jgi:hypothetical protein
MSTMEDGKLHYKVVVEFGDKLYSCYAQGAGRVEYILHDWVSAKEKALEFGYGLLVFDTLSSAKDFCSANWLDSYGDAKYTIFPCYVGRIIGSEKEGTLPFPQSRLEVINLRLSRPITCGEWPKGTVMVETVQLTIERV